jgi:hypothetical protein
VDVSAHSTPLNPASTAPCCRDGAALRRDCARDRASVVATALTGILAQRAGDPELHAEIAALLRDEFNDIEHQVLNEIRV